LHGALIFGSEPSTKSSAPLYSEKNEDNANN